MRGWISTRRAFDGGIFVKICSILGTSPFNIKMYLDLTGSVDNDHTSGGLFLYWSENLWSSSISEAVPDSAGKAATL